MHWNVETDLNAKHGTCLDLLWTVSHVCIICASVPRSHLFCWMRVWVSGVVPLCSFMSQDGNSTIARFHLEQLLIGCHFDETAFVFGSHRDSAFWWAGNVLRWRVFHWMQFQYRCVSDLCFCWDLRFQWEGCILVYSWTSWSRLKHEWAVDYCNYGFNVSCDFQLPPLRLCAATVLRGRLQFLGPVVWSIARWWKMRSEHLQLLVGTFQFWCSHVDFGFRRNGNTRNEVNNWNTNNFEYLCMLLVLQVGSSLSVGQLTSVVFLWKWLVEGFLQNHGNRFISRTPACLSTDLFVGLVLHVAGSARWTHESLLCFWDGDCADVM